MKAKWGLFMTEQKKNTIITSGIAVLAVILAYCLRIVGRGSFYPMLFSYLRSFIYIGLFAAWGLSVRQRIVQKQVCRFMTVTAVLLIIWMVVRSAKYFIFWQPDAVRYLWYLFYLPMLFVPMLALLIAMSLGKPDEYKFPKGMSILWIISGTLLLLVLTNDLHQFVFTFPKDAAVWTEDVSALRDIKEDSELLADELADRNEILRYEYKREAKRRKVEEQNRLYDLLRSATQTQIDRIAELTKEYRRISSTDPDSAKTLLAEIAVLCSYIKRRKHLTLLTDRDIKIAETELHRAFNESLQTLKLLGVRSSLYVDESLSMLSGKTATAVFDFYESVIEADILNLTGIQVSLIKANGLRLSLNVCCKADLSALVSGDSIRCEKEDDEEYQHLVFEAKEGDRK